MIISLPDDAYAQYWAVYIEIPTRYREIRTIAFSRAITAENVHKRNGSNNATCFLFDSKTRMPKTNKNKKNRTIERWFVGNELLKL